MHTTRRAILEFLRAHGSASVEDLAGATGLAPVTVRHHLGILRNQELVAFETEVVGRGRPRHVYHATTRASALLAGNPYEALAGKLVAALKQDDRDAAERLFARLGEEIVASHHASLSELPMAARLDAVVGMLSDEGFVVRWEADDDGTYLVQDLGCPYEHLGDAHAEVCCLDRRLMEVALSAEVEREQWRPAGDPACRFRIRVTAPVDPPSLGAGEL